MVHKEDVFIPHYMNISIPLKLAVNDFVDYRYENGRYLLCKIIAKSVQLNNMMLLHPVGKPIYDTKYDRLVDIYDEYFKLSPAKSICLKQIESETHIFSNLAINDYIDINPRCNGHPGWKNGKIIKLDNNSSQVKVVYHSDLDNKNYSFWVHLLNDGEVAEFRTKCNEIDIHQNELINDNIRQQRNKFTINDIEWDGYDEYDEYHQQTKGIKEDNDKVIEIKEDIVVDDDGDDDNKYDLDDDPDLFIPADIDGDDILNRSIACWDITDNEIASYLLRFNESKWEFNTNSVEIYRLQSSVINHGLMLPHPISIKFPQYLSSITIPSKKQFFANILPPKNKSVFPTSFKQWRVRIIVQETTTTELISRIVLKLKNSLKSSFNHNSDEFILKVVGCNEYMLYDENKLIIDFEAVRKAVRNEDNVKFQLLYIPNLKEIERECFNKNMHHISKYKRKYIDSNLLTQKIINKYKNNKLPSYGSGKSLNEIKSETDKNSKNIKNDKNDKNDKNNGLKDKKSEIRVTVISTDNGGMVDNFDNISTPSSSFKSNSDSFDIPLSQFAADGVFGDDEEIDLLNGGDIISNLPSTADTEYLLNSVNENKNKNEILFHEFSEFYNIKIINMVNVTQFPLFKHHLKKKNNKKWAIIVRHELFIGDLKYNELTFDTDYKHSISDGMRFGNSACFKSDKQKYNNLAREACICFTVYLCKLRGNGNDENDPFEQEIAIAFVRFPIIDQLNLLRNGKYSLNLWPIPVFIDYYKGPKCDAYENESFKYRGPTIDRHLKRFKAGINDNIAVRELQNLFKLSIQIIGDEERKNVNIIALPLNYRFDYDKNKNCKNLAIEQVKKLINRDLLHSYNVEEKQLIFQHRNILSLLPNAFNSFLRCIDWRDDQQRSEAYDYMEIWKLSHLRLEDWLELLSYEFMDTFVREYCVMRISSMPDNDLQIYLLQLVQCLKYELHHNNALIRLLMRRALNNPYQIGHFLFWHLKSEYLEVAELNLHYVERFGLYLEEYLLFSQVNIARDILIQCNLSSALMVINNRLRRSKKENKTPKSKLLEMLHCDLDKLNCILPESFILPIQPKWRCSAVIVDECKTMSSAQMPLWLALKNVDDAVGDDNTIMMFKAGDDLRQDILTLQILRVMDKIWLDRGLNLNLLPYNVVSTGDGQGMVEIVLNSRTTTYIHTHYGGGPQKGARDITTHLKYINDANDNHQERVNKARNIYSRSCAGYSIASYVLGLGDRHPSNIMVRKKGELFHIDFSHFLGNFKSQKVIGDYVKWQREVAPFVFLPANKYCINNGNKNENDYNNFIKYNVSAYLSLRERHKLLINLFILMLPSQMPELIIKGHIDYLNIQLHLNDITNDTDAEKHILQIMKTCLNDKRRIMDNMIHAMVHQ